MWGSASPFQSLQFGGSVHTDVSVCVPLLLHGAPCGSEQGGWGGSSASPGFPPWAASKRVSPRGKRLTPIRLGQGYVCLSLLH